MVEGSAALMHGVGVLMSITHSTLHNDAMRHQQLPDMWPAGGCSKCGNLARNGDEQANIHQRVQLTRFKDLYLLSTFAYTPKHLQLSETYWEKSSLEGAGGRGGGRGAQEESCRIGEGSLTSR